MASELSHNYRNFFKNKSDDEVSIEIPKLTDSTNWVVFRDTFTMKMSHVVGNRGVTLDYVIDNTIRVATRAN